MIRGPDARTRRPPALVLGLLVGLAIGGCRTPEGWTADADEDVEALLAETTFRVLDARESGLVYPEPAAVEVEDGPPAPDADAPAVVPSVDPTPPPVELDLVSSLRAAFDTGREYKTRRETLYLQGLGLTLTRFDFGPQVNAALAALYRDSEQGAKGVDTSASLGVSQILPTGGTVALDGNLSHLRDGTPGAFQNYSSSANVSLFQPLLRGSGYTVSHEALTQAERSMVYEVRDFELFRQDHVISIASDYFDLVSAGTQLLNEERRYADAVFDREKAEALRQLDRNQDEDVFLARRNEIDAENNVLVARADYDVQVDSFRIRLGLPEDEPVTIADEEPPFTRVSLDPDSAVDVALHNRLDLITARERVEDARRRVFISRDRLRPDLGLSVNYGQAGVHNPTTQALDKGDLLDPADDVQLFDPGGRLLDDWSASAGLALEIPIQRTPERNAYRSALIARDRAERDYDILLENVDRDIRNALRQLERTEQQIDLQVQQIGQEDRAVAVTQIRYEAGDVDNRALLEARRAKIGAENALISFKVSHFISRLRLYRDLGLLFIEPDGMWRL